MTLAVAISAEADPKPSNRDLVAKGNEDAAFASRLERYDLAFAFGPLPVTFEESVAKGTLAVRGAVRDRRFILGNDGMVYTFVTLGVQERLKGSVAGETITIRQTGGPMLMPLHDEEKPEPVLAQSQGDPVLSPGDEVVLILVAASDGGQDWYESAWPAASQYRIRGGHIDPLADSPFPELRGLPVAELSRRLREAAAPISDIISEANASSAFAASLPPYGLSLGYREAPATLEEAVSKGSVIVRGVVEGRTFSLHSSSLGLATLDFRVTGQLAGATLPEHIEVVQVGGPAAVPGSPPRLVMSGLETDPLLAPGDEAILVLTPADFIKPGVYATAWPGTSQYRIHDGVAETVPGNPFTELRGISVSDLASRLRNAATP